jgi:hypothetical protein
MTSTLETSSRSKLLLSLIVGALLVLATRIPFLGPGFGVDMDAWRVANVASYFATTGNYSVSRNPGYPLFELASSLVHSQPPQLQNLFTSLFSVLAFVFFSLSLKKLGHRDWWLCGLAFALTPVVYINSVNLMDYLWALAFILGGYTFVLDSRAIPAGILLGLGASCRPTSICFLVPFLMILWTKNKTEFSRKALALITSSVCLQCAFYLVPVLTYGSSLLGISGGNYSRSLSRILYKATIGVWGWVGCLAILGALFSCFIPHVKRAVFTSPPSRAVVLYPSLAVIGIHCGIYLLLPHEPGYLMPAVPFTLIVLSLLVDRRVFAILCLCLMTAPFVEVRLEVNRGPILRDHQTRLSDMETITKLLDLTQSDNTRTVVLVGHLLPQLRYYMDKEPAQVILARSLTQQETERYLSEGYDLFFVPGERELTLNTQGFDLAEFGGKPIQERE